VGSRERGSWLIRRHRKKIVKGPVETSQEIRRLLFCQLPRGKENKLEALFKSKVGGRRGTTLTKRSLTWSPRGKARRDDSRKSQKGGTDHLDGGLSGFRGTSTTFISFTTGE